MSDRFLRPSHEPTHHEGVEIEMPLHNHFAEPLSRNRSWSSIHFAWINYMMEQLNETLLPDQYVPLPSVHLGGQAQVDVGTLEEEQQRPSTRHIANGNTTSTLATWAPPAPKLVFPVDYADIDTYEVTVHLASEGMRLVGAIELISPSNKDRPTHRQAFAAKCAALLQQNVGLIIVDVITERAGNLHAELMELLQIEEHSAEIDHAELYAVACRTAVTESEQNLEVWPEELTLGEPLPRLPLWLAPDLAIPVDFEGSYQRTCQMLRMEE